MHSASNRLQNDIQRWSPRTRLKTTRPEVGSKRIIQSGHWGSKLLHDPKDIFPHEDGLWIKFRLVVLCPVKVSRIRLSKHPFASDQRSSVVNIMMFDFSQSIEGFSLRIETITLKWGISWRLCYAIDLRLSRRYSAEDVFPQEYAIVSWAGTPGSFLEVTSLLNPWNSFPMDTYLRLFIVVSTFFLPSKRLLAFAGMP